jgi:hypothetical protein
MHAYRHNCMNRLIFQIYTDSIPLDVIFVGIKGSNEAFINFSSYNKY